ncbi:MAG: CBS domain-containing protein [Deltaproteobacteria bacterium]|nr:CBS domain-containing protein [Deltaproteobacteria bacterium]
MLVRNWMSKSVITINQDDYISKAIRLMEENNIRMLPVMEKEKMVGIVTERDLKSASASGIAILNVDKVRSLINKTKIKEIMTKDPVTIPWDLTIEEVSEILLFNKIPGVPIMGNKGNLKGIITQTDLFRALISLTGIAKRGIQIGVLIKDRFRTIREIVHTIQKYGGRMVSILSTYNRAREGYRQVYIRFYGMDRTNLPILKEEIREKATMLYIIDQKQNKREFFFNL